MGKRIADMTVTEYRINKKGCECFRSREWEKIREKLEELRAKKPGCKYTVQYRSVHRERNGFLSRDWMGRIAWTPWFDF